MHTVLEIGSGSYKLCWQQGTISEAKQQEESSIAEDANSRLSLTKKFESSLGKNLIDIDGDTEAKKLNPESVKIALNSLDKNILPFLMEKGIRTNEVLVFATAALRVSLNDPSGSGKKFIEELEARGLQGIRVFSEAEECLYAARAVIDEINTRISEDGLENFSILDTGGASHQIIQVINEEPRVYKSFPIGSHTDLSKQNLPDLEAEGFLVKNEDHEDDENAEIGVRRECRLVILGTTGQILTAAESITQSNNLYEEIKKLYLKLKAASIPERKRILEEIIQDKKIRELFVEYRLAVMPQAIAIILNTIKFLKPNRILNSSQESIQYIAKAGF